MHHVFISYSRLDIQWATAFARAVHDRGYPVWIDQRDIPCSVPWFREIQVAIRASALVVVCDSFNWYESPNCTVELSEAEASGVPVIHVDVDSSTPEAAAEQVAARWAALTDGDYARAELRILSQQWQNSGRQKRYLSRGQRLRRMRAVPLDAPGITAESLEYLRRSANRQRRRRTWTAISAVLVILAFSLSSAWLSATTDYNTKLTADLRKGADSLPAFKRADSLLESDPYRGTELTLSLVDEFGPTYFEGQQALVDALANGTPEKVESTGTVPDADQSVARLDGARARLVDGGTAVVVRSAEPGESIRRIPLQQPGSAVTFLGSDGEVAVGTGRLVRLFEVAAGREIGRLVGAPDTVQRLEYLPAQDRVRATVADGTRVTWQASRVDATATNDGRWYVDAAALGRSGAVAALDRSGRVDLLSATDGTVIRSWRGLPSPIRRLAAHDGLIAAVTPTDQSVELLDAASGAHETLDATGCDPYDVDFDRAGEQVLLACASKGIGHLALADKKLTFTQVAGPGEAFSVAAAEDGFVYGTYTGVLVYEGGPAGTIFEGTGQACQSTLSHLAVGGGYAFNAGPGATTICGGRYSLHSDTLKMSPLLVSGGISDDGRASSEAVAVSPDGRFVALGMANGAVEVFDVDSLNPVSRITGGLGSIRGLAFDTTTGNLVAVTRQGQVRVYGKDLWAPSLTQSIEELQARLDQAKQWGLYQPETQS